VSLRVQECDSKKAKSSEIRQLGAIEVIAGNDVWAARLIFVGGTISGIVTALDAGPRTSRFNELDIVIIPKARTPLWVTLAS